MFVLNMFKSSFALPEKHADKAPYAALWNDEATLAHLHRDAAGRPTYLLHDGPPYANGSLHLGHFVNKTLKDAVLKYKRLDGYFAPFLPGFDCHGLPVELEVEKQGVSKADPVAFVRACRAYALRQVALQTAEFKDFGVAADWGRAYKTLEPAFEAGAAEYFSHLPQRVKRLRPVHWCAACGSSLAEAEVEYKPKTSDSLEVLFALLGADGAHDGRTFLQVWTTTPYTLPANRAVGFHAGFRYEAVPVADSDRLLVRVASEGENLGTVVDLAGRSVRSPWTGATVPLLAADFVTSAGTGLVHLAPSFGMDDFRVCETHGLAAERFLDDRGCYEAGPLKGLSLADASAAVVATLQERGLVHSHDRLEHEYPHCWRHKKPVFFKASEEWFLDLTEVGPQALASLDDVTFTPANGRERMAGMLNTRSSWCLSRNRLWGSPLRSEEGDAALVEQVRSEGVEAWHAAGPRRTLDVWFDSGVTHELVLKQLFGRTADLYLEGTDQHRGWFQSSLLTSVAATGRAPFKALLTHGFVVDEQNKKYSKSSRNYQPLDKLFAQHSPDVLRLWTLSQDTTRDLKMSPVSLQRTVERYRKLRNTLRFCLQNTVDFDFTCRAAPTGLLHEHQASEMARVLRETREAADRHDFAACVASVLQFCEATSSDYFTAMKDTLYCDAADAPKRLEAQSMLASLLDFLLRVLMPVLPYTVEEVFQLMRERMGYAEPCSLHLTFDPLTVEEVPTCVAALKELKAEVNRFVEADPDEGLKSPAQLDLVVSAPVALEADELASFFGCSGVRVLPAGNFRVTMQRTGNRLCPRCRRHHASVRDGLCARCEEVEPLAAQAA